MAKDFCHFAEKWPFASQVEQRWRLCHRPEHPELPPFLAAPARRRPEDRQVFFFFARRQGINQLDDTKKKTNPVLGPNQHRKPRNITETGTRFLSRADPVAHLVRVGVSWNTADSSRVSGLIARQLYSIPLEYQILQEGDGGFQPAWIRRPVEASIDFGGGKCW